jgi:predicted site-specific integrase-resolvase
MLTGAPAVLSRRDLAELFGVTPLTVSRWFREGRLPPPLPLSRWPRWRVKDIEAILERPLPSAAPTTP